MSFLLPCFPFEELPLTFATIVSHSNNVNFLNICKVIQESLRKKMPCNMILWMTTLYPRFSSSELSYGWYGRLTTGYALQTPQHTEKQISERSICLRWGADKMRPGLLEKWKAGLHDSFHSFLTDRVGVDSPVGQGSHLPLLSGWA